DSIWTVMALPEWIMPDLLFWRTFKLTWNADTAIKINDSKKICPSLRQDGGKLTIVIALRVTQWSLIVNFLDQISSFFSKNFEN
ncbi:hypothetical protein RJJ65_34615, partial [Rhizobium hidalgonense]